MLPVTTLVFCLSFLLVCIFIRKAIFIAHKKNLFDEPAEQRKVHLIKTPNLGGAAIVPAFFLAICFFVSSPVLPNLNYILFSAVLLFLTGLADDLVGINALKKMILQLLVAVVLVAVAGCRFRSLDGFMGIEQLPEIISIIMSAGFIVTVINAFNLIDGINFLAGSIGIFAMIIFSICFYRLHIFDLMLIAVSMIGCLSGFLIFNRTPAKIFLGDSGSTFLGFLVAVLSIFIANGSTAGGTDAPGIFAGHGFVILIIMAATVIPVFDTIRIFLVRIARRQSPFVADRRHIHHRLLDIGFSHWEATVVLLLVNILVLAEVVLLRQLAAGWVMVIVVFSMLLADCLLTFHLRKLNRGRSAGKRRQLQTTGHRQVGKLKVIVKNERVL